MKLPIFVGLGGVMPRYMTLGSCAFDIACAEEVYLEPGGYVEMKFNLVFEIPPGYVLYVRPRNSTFKRYRLIFVGSGIVDEDYCGVEDLVNFPVYYVGKKPITIKEGVRIAQGMIIKVEKVEFTTYQPTGGSRGGTGSTGV